MTGPDARRRLELIPFRPIGDGAGPSKFRWPGPDTLDAADRSALTRDVLDAILRYGSAPAEHWAASKQTPPGDLPWRRELPIQTLGRSTAVACIRIPLPKVRPSPSRTRRRGADNTGCVRMKMFVRCPGGSAVGAGLAKRLRVIQPLRGPMVWVRQGR